MPDYESMTVDELDARSVELKHQIEVLRGARREIKAVRDVKVEQAHIAAGIERAGLTGIVVVPDAAEIRLRIGAVAVAEEE